MNRNTIYEYGDKIHKINFYRIRIVIGTDYE